MANETLNVRASDILDEDQSNCVLCSEKDTIEMISCDGCRQWFHFSCVGVDKSIAGRDWICADYIAQFKMLTKVNADREKELSSKLEDLESHRQRQMRFDELQRKMEELKCSLEQISKRQTVKNQSQQPQLDPANQEHQIQHFLARQTISRELPQFFGSPEQWPTFIAAYEYSTNACKYSDVENLCRLQKALKGDARKMVESFLAHPSNVPTIIETLKMLYGRPALIIQSQIDSIKRSPAPKADKLDSLVFYAVQVRNLIAAVDSADVKEYLNDMRLLQELVERLPAQIRLNWGMCETHVADEPKLKQFSNWLNTVAQGACNVMSRIPQITKSSDNRVNVHDYQIVEPVPERTLPQTEIAKCQICLHKSCANASQCNKFVGMSFNERWSVVNRFKLCRMCVSHHKSPRCQKAKECGINQCKRLHHPLLHKDDGKPTNSHGESTSTVASMHRNRNDILFRIVPVTLKNNNLRIDTYAFLDDGSSITLLEKETADLLRFKGSKRQLCMRWTDGQSHVESDSRMGGIQIAPLQDQVSLHGITVQTISHLDLPMQTINRNALQEKYEHLRNIPFDSFENAKPTLLIGLDNWHLCVPTKVEEGSHHEPVATKTRLGWDLCGIDTSSSASSVFKHRINAHICDCTDRRLEEVVKEFHALDSIGIFADKDYQLTEEEKRAERLMKDSTIQKGTNFEVSLLWRYDQFQLPDSYPMAYKRLLCLERKLLGRPRLLEAFRNQMEHYVENGFMRKLSPFELQASYQTVWYLPVFIVENPNKPGKIRLVFDAAAKVDGISLNTMLLRGRDLVSPLIQILMRFRIPKYALIGDIREMFHMVHVRNEDQMVQRILWRDCQQAQEPDVYVMTVMTFGATCSPYQAQYVIRLNASKYSSDYPQTVKSITNNTYVDDVLDGRETEDELTTLVEQMQFIHSQAGFEIRNFNSNSPKLKMEHNTNECTTLHSINDNGAVEKVLGIFWCVDNDCITFSLRFNKANREVLMGKRRPTKRIS